MTPLIRVERTADPQERAGIFAVHRAAFLRDGTAPEAPLVDRLREEADPYLGLVAVYRGALIAHIAFSPVTVDSTPPDLLLLALGPLAVAPAYQRRGVGSALTVAGLAQCKRRGAAAVFLLGHTWFYPRLGFRPAADFGCRYGAKPSPHFMAQELQPDALRDVAGEVHFHPAFDDV